PGIQNSSGHGGQKHRCRQNLRQNRTSPVSHNVSFLIIDIRSGGILLRFFIREPDAAVPRLTVPELSGVTADTVRILKNPVTVFLAG
ncbi:MAG: hypothetical protein IJV76_08525, partial [Clostridia bacterium]|nr:hypothetical protein [Clostridia bacterium]